MAVAFSATAAITTGAAPAIAQQDEGLVSLAATVAELEDPAQPVFKPEAQSKFEKIAEGIASYYGHELAGNRTASGERFNPQALTAAHRTLPLGTKLRVTNLSNGKSVVVRVNDRGPFVGKRILDLSLAAAREINMIRSGHARVAIEIVRSA
jgi:rare lipoprotein A